MSPFLTNQAATAPQLLKFLPGAIVVPNQVVATLNGAVLPPPPPPPPPARLVVPALPAPPPRPGANPMRTWGYEPPPHAARDRPYHPITDCWLDEDGY